MRHFFYRLVIFICLISLGIKLNANDSVPSQSIILDSAVQDAKAMQDFKLESLLRGPEHSQMVKAVPLKSDYDSKDCDDLVSSIAESRIIESNTEKARSNLLLLLSGEWISRALYVVTKLEISDYLQDGPKSIQEIAAFSHSKPESLQRLLHMLVGFGVFEEQDSGIFMNNDVSSLLVQSNPDSLHKLSVFYGEDIHTAWDQFLESINTGIPAFQLCFEQPVFSYFKEHPDRATLFQEAMKEKSTAVIKSSLSAYNFGQFSSIYDIGGGYGHFLLGILQKYSHLKGMIFDLPEVINAIPQKNPQLLREQCTLSSGDFFDSVPKGADAYLLKSVLHDWNDSKVEHILKNCYQAMNQNCRSKIEMS